MQLPYGNSAYRIEPTKVIALGANYREHIAESGTLNVRGFNSDEPDEPILFPKLPSSITGPDQPIIIPEILGAYDFPEERTDYEGELALIIGDRCKDVSVDDAYSYILGVTCANDVSQRDIQNGDRAGWFRGKSFDTFLPIGPRIVPFKDISDIQNLRVVTRLNGTVVQEGNTKQMIFPVAETIAFVSRNFTLLPGDIILTGTPAGVGPIHGGDTVEVEIESIGTLTNPVVDPRR